LFLDEINSMPLVLQAKLLRVLQDHKVRRVGGLFEKKIDLRIISATNVNPLEAIESQRLRSDLYYRLAVVQVRIPPLRERTEDIPYLADFFLDSLNLKLGKKVTGIALACLHYLRQRHWPGTVRELEHMIESAMNFAYDGEELSERHFRRLNRHMGSRDALSSARSAEAPPSPGSGRPSSPAPAASVPASAAADIGARPGNWPAKFKWEAEKEERAKLVEALGLSRGIISRAAEYLGLSPQLTSYRMRKHKLRREDFKDR
jgi:arginine utilization regulatory protein